VLTFYRRHPERARARLLDLLGEALSPAALAPQPGAKTADKGTAKPSDDGRDLWLSTQKGVAPLKRKR
jgi:hypothetical protein